MRGGWTGSFQHAYGMNEKDCGIITECAACGKKPLDRDTVGINKKMLGSAAARCYCLDCLAEYLECRVDQLQERIAEYKRDGCTLFK